MSSIPKFESLISAVLEKYALFHRLIKTLVDVVHSGIVYGTIENALFGDTFYHFKIFFHIKRPNLCKSCTTVEKKLNLIGNTIIFLEMYVMDVIFVVIFK